MNRIFLIVIAMTFFSFATELSANQVFQASKIPGLPLSEFVAFDTAYGTNEYPVINGSTLIYVHQDDDSTDLFSYDLKQLNSVLLYSVPYGIPVPSNIAPQVTFGSTGKKSFLIIEGKLIVTDGGVSGTTAIRDFGTGFCCFIGSFYSKAQALTTINDIFYFSVAETENIENIGDLSTKVTLWRSDGTASGTYPMSEPPALERIVMPFKHSNFEKESIFYFGQLRERANLWRINDVGETELYHSFSGINGIFGYQTRVISTTKGSFFCTSNTGPNAAGQLWRISNSGELSVIANGCDADSLSNINDRIYYENTEGLWFSDGTPLGTSMIHSFPVSPASAYIKQCTIGADSYRVLNRNNLGEDTKASLLKVMPNNVVSVVNSNLSDGHSSTITACLDDGIVINVESNSFRGRFSLFASKTEEFFRISHLSRRIPSKTASSLSSNSFFVNGDLVPFYLTPYNPASILPSINMLLESPQN